MVKLSSTEPTPSTGSSKPQLPSSSTFSFKAPFPASSLASSSTLTPLKQRRVSLALPSSPRLVPAWSFRDDTSLDSHVAEIAESSLTPEKRRRIANNVGDDLDSVSSLSLEKKQRKKWTPDETQMLVDGCNLHGVGNWKTILSDPNLKFDNRSPVDLKDRFRTYFPDAYKQHYPNAKTHLSSKVRSTLPDGSSLFEKTRSKKRRPFTEEEDRALRAGYEKHGTVWATIVKDPVFQEQNRRSTDLRDRFRNAFPDLYQAAGYKPRNTFKKKRGDDAPKLPVRAATDDQLSMSSTVGPVRRRRANTNQGLLRGGTKSVPQSATCSEDEDSSGGEEEMDAMFNKPRKLAPIDKLSASPEDNKSSSESFNEIDIDPNDPLLDPLSIPDFLPSSHSDMDSQTWSSGIGTPTHSHHAWSTTAGSPTSSHLSTDYLINQSPFHRRSDGMGMIGKSAWGTQDWLSANPRLDPHSGGNSSYVDGLSPSSPFSFHNLNHGVLDRYDLFPTSMPHDFTSEVGVGDSHSTFSDEMFPSSGFRGFTHHSNYAGDLIFGARSHQPQSFYGPDLGFGLGLTNMQPSAGIHPMQLHTPALPGIDEIELTGITLTDTPQDIMEDATDALGLKNNADAPMDIPDAFSLHSLEDIVDLSHDLHSTPPGTPITQPRAILKNNSMRRGHYSSTHGRSISVPPSEIRNGHSRPPQLHANSQLELTATRSLPLFSSLMQASEHSDTSESTSPSCHPHAPGIFGSVDSSPHDAGRSLNDPYNLSFLDLHYYGSNGAGSLSSSDLLISTAESEHHRQGQALDLAQPAVSILKSLGIPLGQNVPPVPSIASHTVSAGSALGPVRPHSMHHRGLSAVSPQDLLLRKGTDNKRKRASWDGGAS